MSFILKSAVMSLIRVCVFFEMQRTLQLKDTIAECCASASTSITSVNDLVILKNYMQGGNLRDYVRRATGENEVLISSHAFHLIGQSLYVR